MTVHPSLAPRVTTAYLEGVLDEAMRARRVEHAIDALEPHRNAFDAIAVRGVSGLTMGAILAHELHKPLIVVRKDGETRHSDSQVEGAINWRPLARYLIVDDFIASGETLRQIQHAIGGQAIFVGYYLWSGCQVAWTDDPEDYADMRERGLVV